MKHANILGTVYRNHSKLYNEILTLVFRALGSIPCRGEQNGVGSRRGEKEREQIRLAGAGGIVQGGQGKGGTGASRIGHREIGRRKGHPW